MCAKIPTQILSFLRGLVRMGLCVYNMVRSAHQAVDEVYSFIRGKTYEQWSGESLEQWEVITHEEGPDTGLRRRRECDGSGQEAVVAGMMFMAAEEFMARSLKVQGPVTGVKPGHLKPVPEGQQGTSEAFEEMKQRRGPMKTRTVEVQTQVTYKFWWKAPRYCAE